MNKFNRKKINLSKRIKILRFNLQKNKIFKKPKINKLSQQRKNKLLKNQQKEFNLKNKLGINHLLNNNKNQKKILNKNQLKMINLNQKIRKKS